MRSIRSSARSSMRASPSLAASMISRSSSTSLVPLRRARLLFVGGIDDLADPLVHLLVLDPERLQVELRHLDFTDRLARELRADRDRLFDGAGLERERHGLPIENLDELRVTHFVDANLLLALEPAD